MANTESVAADEKPFVAQRLDLLFAMAKEKAGRKLAAAAVAEGINAAAGEKVIDQTYIWQLRTGRKDNPSYNVLIQLAQYFGVSPMFFFPDDSGLAVGANLQAALSDERVRDLALVATGLSDPSIDAITVMAKHVRALEGLPNLSA